MNEMEARALLAEEYRKAGRDFKAELVMKDRRVDEAAVAAILRVANPQHSQ